jgi:DNA polymerase II small subunit
LTTSLHPNVVALTQGSDVVEHLARRGYNVDPDAATRLEAAADPQRAIDAAIDAAPATALKITIDHAEAGIEAVSNETDSTSADHPTGDVETARPAADSVPSETATPGSSTLKSTASEAPTDQAPAETKGGPPETKGSSTTDRSDSTADRTPETPAIENDITGRSTGTGTYEDFVATFRDRYERLASQLRPRVTHRPTEALEDAAGGGDVALIGAVSDLGSTKNGHHIVELEDTTGTFRTLVTNDRDEAARVRELMLDEVIAVEGTLSDDGEIVFVDAVHFPDVPRTYSPSTADRHVQAALISDVHVGSQEFLTEAWRSFADWLHTDEADAVEYLLIAGDMVEGIGVYPDQDEELSIVDIYDQYERFAEELKAVPGDVEIVMIPGNHDAVRLAEPQPAFDEELRSIMNVHDARFTGNPSTVTIEGVSILMYHGVSLDQVIADVPGQEYEAPHEAMGQLLKKRHLAPRYGGRIRLAPEEQDYLVIDEVPDVFHAGHVHKIGVGQYHNVRTINSGCWQAQTAFQASVNIDPDAGYAPILDLDTLDVTLRKFS